MAQIEIIVSPNGQSEVQTQGFEGADCLAKSQFLEHALGNRVGEQLTSEFYQSQTSVESREIEKQ